MNGFLNYGIDKPHAAFKNVTKIISCAQCKEFLKKPAKKRLQTVQKTSEKVNKGLRSIALNNIYAITGVPLFEIF